MSTLTIQPDDLATHSARLDRIIDMLSSGMILSVRELERLGIDGGRNHTAMDGAPDGHIAAGGNIETHNVCVAVNSCYQRGDNPVIVFPAAELARNGHRFINQDGFHILPPDYEGPDSQRGARLPLAQMPFRVLAKPDEIGLLSKVMQDSGMYNQEQIANTFIASDIDPYDYANVRTQEENELQRSRESLGLPSDPAKAIVLEAAPDQKTYLSRANPWGEKRTQYVHPSPTHFYQPGEPNTDTTFLKAVFIDDGKGRREMSLGGGLTMTMFDTLQHAEASGASIERNPETGKIDPNARYVFFKGEDDRLHTTKFSVKDGPAYMIPHNESGGTGVSYDTIRIAMASRYIKPTINNAVLQSAPLFDIPGLDLSGWGVPPPPPPPLPAVETAPSAKNMLSTEFDRKASRGMVGADVALSLANGNVGQAATSLGMVFAEKAVTSEVVEDAARTGLKAVGFGAKRVPIVGAFVTAAFVLGESGSHALRGEWGKAGGALAAGVAETAGNIFGFGIGDVAREAVRGGIVMAAGEENAPEKSGIRQLTEGGYTLASRLISKNDL